VEENTKINESSLSRVWEHMEKHDTGTITAFRSASECNQGEPFSKSDNKKRNKSLQAKLNSLRYGVTKVKGSYIEDYDTPQAKEVGEDVFFVVDLDDKGNLEKDLKKLGEEFEQDSILFVPKGGDESRLVGTNKCPNGYPGYGKVVSYKHRNIGKSGEFFTRVKGRPFMFGECADPNAYRPEGMMGRWACKAISDKPWQLLEDTEED